MRTARSTHGTEINVFTHRREKKLKGAPWGP
jgi:hypothetical protein